MICRSLVRLVGLWLIFLGGYSSLAIGNEKVNEKDIEEAWGKGNRSGGYSFGINYRESTLCMTFHQSMENLEISVCSGDGAEVYQSCFSPVKGEVYTIDLSGYDETLFIQVQLSDGRLFTTYY